MNKADINLLPQKTKLPAYVTLGLPLGLTAFVVLAIFSVLVPQLLLQAKQYSLNSLETELANYSQIQTEYTSKLEESNTARDRQTNYDEFVKTDKQTIELYNAINQVKPASITILSENFDNDKIVLTGVAKDDTDIARYEVELRKLNLFPEIILSSITGTNTERNFSFTLMHEPSVTSQEGVVSK